MKDERLRPFIENHKEYIAMCVKRTINFEGRHTANLMYLCSLIIAHEKEFYNFNRTLATKLFKVIHRFA